MADSPKQQHQQVDSLQSRYESSPDPTWSMSLNLELTTINKIESFKFQLNPSLHVMNTMLCESANSLS